MLISSVRMSPPKTSQQLLLPPEAQPDFADEHPPVWGISLLLMQLNLHPPALEEADLNDKPIDESRH